MADRPPAVAMSWAAVSARRMARSGLSRPAADASPADIAGLLCGAHAQLISAAEVSIALRIAGATRAAVRDALWTEHSLVKTLGPRGTVHLLPCRDLPMWTGALSALPLSPGGQAKDVRLSAGQTDEVVAAIGTALADAELTIDELSEAVIAATGSWAGGLVLPAFQGMWPRWRQALGTAAGRGALCFGHNRGAKVTYTSPRRWLPGFAPAEGQAALRALVRRYLHAYGPASSQHFAQWLNVSRRWAADLFDGLADELTAVDLDGTPAWVLRDDTAAAPAPAPGVRLLPYFDSYVVGGQPRGMLFPGPAASRALTRTGQAGNYPVLLIDGTVAGVWHQARSAAKLSITVEPLAPLSARRRRELSDEAERIGQILEATSRLSIGTVTTGPHA